MRVAIVTTLLMLACGKEHPNEDASRAATAPATDTSASSDIEGHLRMVPDRPRAEAHARIELTLPGIDTRDLEPIGGKLVHIVAVNRELTWYRHAHPVNAGTAYTADIEFPTGGEYVVYGIYKPRDRSQAVSKLEVTVDGPRRASAPLRTTPLEYRSGSHVVTLRTNPDPPSTSDWNALRFTLTRDGKPVTDLTPTGTLGHIIILREGGEDFVYAHSSDGEARSGIRARAHAPAVPPSAGSDHSRHVGDTGPEVTFHTRFPTIGKYRMWVEFRAGDDTIKADFVVDVGEPPPPPEHRD